MGFQSNMPPTPETCRNGGSLGEACPPGPIFVAFPLRVRFRSYWLKEHLMSFRVIVALALLVGSSSPTIGVPASVLVAQTYEARIRLNGKVSTTQVQASDAGQAKKLVQTQFPTATVLSVKRVD